jgi:hypothetical protein
MRLKQFLTIAVELDGADTQKRSYNRHAPAMMMLTVSSMPLSLMCIVSAIDCCSVVFLIAAENVIQNLSCLRDTHLYQFVDAFHCLRCAGFTACKVFLDTREHDAGHVPQCLSKRRAQACVAVGIEGSEHVL